jgi:hypothetical protein
MFRITSEIMELFCCSLMFVTGLKLLKSYHLSVVGGPSIPHDPENDAGGSLSSW